MGRCWPALWLAAACSQPQAPSQPEPAPAPETALDTKASPEPVVQPAKAAQPVKAVQPAKAVTPTSTGPFVGADAARLDLLRKGKVVKIKKGSGGRSLGFKLYFEDGTKAYYKPEQTFSGTNWYAEVAAHYLDRALGLYRVPPVVSRAMPWARLKAVAGNDKRVQEVIVGDDGRVRGALVDWVTTPLERAVTPAGWENWIRVDSFARWSISPYQRPRVYADQLKARKQAIAAGEKHAEPAYDEVPAPDREELPAELSDMLVFDHLTINIDRWGGTNVNVLTMGKPGPLIYLDNAAGFSVGPHDRGLMDDRFKVCQRFRKSTIDALRALDMVQLKQALGADPLGPLLSDHMLEGIDVRRKGILLHVQTLTDKHGAQVQPW